VIDTAIGEFEIPLAAQRLTFKSEIFERLKKEYPNQKMMKNLFSN
jgi:hypothetical protein